MSHKHWPGDWAGDCYECMFASPRAMVEGDIYPMPAHKYWWKEWYEGLCAEVLNDAFPLRCIECMSLASERHAAWCTWWPEPKSRKSNYQWFWRCKHYPSSIDNWAWAQEHHNRDRCEAGCHTTELRWYDNGVNRARS